MFSLKSPCINNPRSEAIRSSRSLLISILGGAGKQYEKNLPLHVKKSYMKNFL